MEIRGHDIFLHAVVGILCVERWEKNVEKLYVLSKELSIFW